MDAKSVTFSVVQTIENGLTKLSVVPGHWTEPNGWNNGILDSQHEYRGRDVMYWPYNAIGSDLLDAAENDINSLPNDEDCRRFRCIIKRKNLACRIEVRYILVSYELFNCLFAYVYRLTVKLHL